MWLVLVIFAVTLVYFMVQRQYNYWTKRGIPGPKPLPFVGNIGPNLIGKVSVGEIYADIYRKYKDHPFVGIYKGGVPCLLIRDVDFIKNIATKDFNHFSDNGMFVDKKVEPLFGRNPFFLSGEEWRTARSQRTPCFTSGKMKGVFPIVDEMARRMVEYVANKKEATTSLEAKDLCKKFIIEIGASSAFGIESKCFDDNDSELEELVRNLSPVVSIKLVTMLLFPKLAYYMPSKLIPKHVEDRVISMVKSAMRYRRDNNVERNDFLDFSTKLTKTTPNFTDLDVTAHALSFLSDGLETSSHVMSHCLFELASNPEVQNKLRTEINDTFEKYNQQFSYEALQEMAYLDACLNESMRKNPPAFSLVKVCTEEYTYSPSNPEYKNISVTVEPGTPIIFPNLGLHLDPKYYECPEKYMPDRFLNKEDLEKYAYLPFGQGPRMCLGQRFAVMQVKVGVAHIVKNFDLTVNPKTQLPLSYGPWHIFPLPKGGLWLDFHKI